MKRSELEHVLRAAGAITLHQDFVVIGSQAVLGQHPDAPEELLVSRDVDLYPRAAPEDSALIDGVIGEGSTFHETFGYYAHGVGPETAVLPEGWEDRLVEVRNENTGGSSGWCIEVHDLAVSKLVAAREHDLDFVRSLLRHGLVAIETVRERLDNTTIDNVGLDLCRQRLARVVGT